MLIGGLVGVVVVLASSRPSLVRRRTHDDVHSVEHYHRQLHTLEEIRIPPVRPRAGRERQRARRTFPASAFRVSGSSTVRLTEPGKPWSRPSPHRRCRTPAEPVTFDDSRGAERRVPPPSFMTGSEDRAMHAINHRPRRLGGPAAGVAAVPC